MPSPLSIDDVVSQLNCVTVENELAGKKLNFPEYNKNGSCRILCRSAA